MYNRKRPHYLVVLLLSAPYSNIMTSYWSWGSAVYANLEAQMFLSMVNAALALPIFGLMSRSCLATLWANHTSRVDEGFSLSDGLINICDWCLESGGDLPFSVVYFDLDSRSWWCCFCPSFVFGDAKGEPSHRQSRDNWFAPGLSKIMKIYHSSCLMRQSSWSSQ